MEYGKIERSLAELSESDKKPFQLSPTDKVAVVQTLSKEPVSIAGLAMRLNGVIAGNVMQLLSAKRLEEALTSAGYLTYDTSNDGRICKTPT